MRYLIKGILTDDELLSQICDSNMSKGKAREAIISGPGLGAPVIERFFAGSMKLTVIREQFGWLVVSNREQVPFVSIIYDVRSLQIV